MAEPTGTGMYQQTEDESYIAAVEAQPPVHDAVARLDKQLSRLFSMIDDLSGQLASVRNVAPTTETPKTLRDVGGVSALASTLGNMVERVRDEQERLTVLMSELEV